MASNFLGISGSLRKASYNRKLVLEAGRLFSPLKLTEADINLPLYDGDVEDEAGIPDTVRLLAEQIISADAIVVATPEYNQSLSGVLKNALDWVSRVEGRPWAGKPVALVSAAAGRSGGARASYALRLAMTPFRTKLLQGELLVAAPAKAFDEGGRLTDEHYLNSLSTLMDELRKTAELPKLERS